MIVYLATKLNSSKMFSPTPPRRRFSPNSKKRLCRSVGNSEVLSWKNSMGYLHRVLVDSEILNDAGVAIELNIPQTYK
jgi:hypothetical protein